LYLYCGYEYSGNVGRKLTSVLKMPGVEYKEVINRKDYLMSSDSAVKLFFLIAAVFSFFWARIVAKPPVPMPKSALCCVVSGLADLVLAVVW
jgi:hypothetical protein